jgi:predicted amidohydrolase YtcJ
VFAEIIFSGGAVFSAGRVHMGSVAVRDGRILAVGQVSDLVGPHTSVLDTTGRMLIPAFHDAHAHPVWGGLELMRCNLAGASDKSGYQAIIAQYVRDNPGRGWVTGAGWAMAAFPSGTPKASDLDDLVPDRPVLLHNADHHGAWVNSVALSLAGITAATPDPPDGRIEREADGSPTGMLHEGAVALVSRLLPPADLGEYVAALRLGQAHLHSLGVAGWQDAIVGPYGGYADPLPAYRALASAGALTARVCGALWWDRTLGVSQIPSLLDRRVTSTGLSTPHVKIMLDGVAENFTAAMSTPYLHGKGSGLPFVDFAALPAAVKALVEAGFGVHYHAIGDAAVSAALDAAAFAGTGRHQIAHLQVVRPADISRFADLGVIANMQAFWACHEPQLDTLAIPFLGTQRAGWLYSFGDLVRAGAPVACGSDWPVSSANPWDAIHVAVNRSYLDGEPLLPAQKLDLSTVLTAYTHGSALACGFTDTGLITPGYSADLALLDRDPFSVAPSSLREVRVIQTYAGGALVHDAA